MRKLLSLLLLVQAAVQERIAKLHRSRLARECVKLDRAEEQALAEDRYAADVKWPDY